MVNKKTSVKIEGGMDPKWRSTVRKSSAVSAITKEKAEAIIKDAESRINSRYPDNGFSFHYKTAELPDRGWGKTFLIVPISPIAKAAKNKKFLNSAANTVAARKKS